MQPLKHPTVHSAPRARLVGVLICTALLPSARAQYSQQATLSPTEGGLNASVAVSADGSTIIIGSPFENSLKGTASIYGRSGGAWVLQADKIAPTGSGYSAFGSAVALSADGSLAAVGASGTTDGGVYIFTRSGSTWTQQGSKILGTGSAAFPAQGSAVALSADAKFLFVGGPGDNFSTGAVWIFARSGSTWAQQGNKLVGTGGVGPFIHQGVALAASADGSTFVVGANGDSNSTGAAWIYTRSGNNSWQQQGGKLVGAGAVAAANQSVSVAISGDGNTVLLGHPLDNGSAGAAWVFTRSNGTWTQQGNKLTGTGAVGSPQQGTSVALSNDGNTAVIGGPDDNPFKGAAWVFKRNGGAWAQQGAKLVGTGGGSFQGTTLSITPDASTLVVGGVKDAWVFVGPAAAGNPTPSNVGPSTGSGSTQTFTFNFSDGGGFARFTVLDVLFSSALDGRQACYAAIVPSGPNGAAVYLVDDAGDAGGPYAGMVLPGSQSVSNGQCTIYGTGSSIVGSGNNITLTLAVTFSPTFSGNKIVYVASQDTTSNSGWQPLGTWNVPGAAPPSPSVTSLTTGQVNGLSRTYTFTFTDTNGWQDISVANILINSAINGVGACYVAVVPSGPAAGSVYLVDDAGDAAGPYSGMVLPSSSSVSNGQCNISAAGSSVAGSGTTLQVTLAVTFTPGFGGNRIIFAAVGGASRNSGWQPVGTVAVQ